MHVWSSRLSCETPAAPPDQTILDGRTLTHRRQLDGTAPHSQHQPAQLVPTFEAAHSVRRPVRDFGNGRTAKQLDSPRRHLVIQLLPNRKCAVEAAAQCKDHQATRRPKTLRVPDTCDPKHANCIAITRPAIGQNIDHSKHHRRKWRLETQKCAK